MVSCPFCKTETDFVTKEWNYSKGYYHVKSFRCQFCGLDFRGYFHNEQLSYTIPRSPSNKSKVKLFLRRNGVVAKEEMARRLRLSLKELGELLIEMEKEGLVQQVS
jgi:transposase-like protein